jgi:hypothetical protein
LFVSASFAFAAEEIKGSAKFSIVDPIFVAGKEMKSGTYDVKYVVTGTDAAVTFTLVQQHKPVLEAKGKIVNSEQKFQENIILVGKDSSGKSVGKTFQLSGKKFSIVFE